MNRDISDYRKSYEKEALLESTAEENPLKQFEKWFQSADENDFIEEPNAMTLSTVGLDGYPKARVVLLKQFDESGFLFYTNYESEKGLAIESNQNVCLSFFWPAEERQVIIKGTAEKISEEKSTAYFQSRPEGSQLGALVSNQSQPIESREVLEEKLQQLEERYKGKPIPKPQNWGGYRVKPVECEFWQGRANRLHDRIRYQLNQNKSWTMVRLAP